MTTIMQPGSWKYDPEARHYYRFMAFSRCGRRIRRAKIVAALIASHGAAAAIAVLVVR